VDTDTKVHTLFGKQEIVASALAAADRARIRSHQLVEIVAHSGLL
jgi:hypothetical protein